MLLGWSAFVVFCVLSFEYIFINQPWKSWSKYFKCYLWKPLYAGQQAVASLLAWLVCGPNKKFLPNYDGGNIISLAKWLLQFFLYGDLFAWRGFLHTKIHLECAIYFLFANSEFVNQENRESIPIKFIVDQLIMGLFVFKTIKLSNCTIFLWFILHILFVLLFELLNMLGNICKCVCIDII